MVRSMQFQNAPTRRVLDEVMDILTWPVLAIGATGAAFGTDSEKPSQEEGEMM